MTDTQKRDDDVYLSEDSESTQGSDLDYDITIEVVLPDKSKTKTTIPANTPLSDLRTQLCSNFKLSPSLHTVDFVGDSSQNGATRRKASLAVGKLGLSSVKIERKPDGIVPKSPPPTVRDKEQSTVRLLVHLDRLRQIIVRVNPDAPLTLVFQVICDKLNLPAATRGRVELHHPKLSDLHFNLKHSLNYYNLREINFGEKKDNPPKKPPAPVRNKRKAPPPPKTGEPPASPPPRPAPPRKSPPPAKVGPPRPTPPVRKAIQNEPPKVTKRRAPIKPTMHTKVPDDVIKKTGDVTNETGDVTKENDDVTKETGDVTKENDDVTKETGDVTKETGDVTKENDDVTKGNDDVTKQTHDVTNEGGDVIKEVNDVIIDPDDIIDELDDIIELHDSSLTSVDHDRDGSRDDETHDDLNHVNGEGVPHKPVRQKHKPDVLIVDDDDIIITDDDVIDPSIYSDIIKEGKEYLMLEEMKYEKQKDNVQEEKLQEEKQQEEKQQEEKQQEEKQQEEKQQEEKLQEEKLQEEKLQEEKQQEEKLQEEKQQEEKQQEEKLQEEKQQEEKQQEEKLQEEKLQEEKLQEEKLQEKKQKENKQEEHKIEIALIEKETEQNVQQEESQQEESQQEESQQEESQQEESQQEESQQEEFPPPPLFLLDGEFPVMGNGTKLDDLEYESVSLPSNGGSITTIQQNIDESAKLDRNANNFPKQESPLTETDKTAIEIEKLHAQIRRMRNSQKKKEKSQNRNAWHPGSLVFVPKNTNTTHKDIEVAPTTGIELSNDGEIKRNKQKPNKETTNEQPAPRGRPTLPSYYKKFLGVNAFTAGEEQK